MLHKKPYLKIGNITEPRAVADPGFPVGGGAWTR